MSRWSWRARTGIKVIIAEMDNTVPQLLYHDCPELLCGKRTAPSRAPSIGAKHRYAAASARAACAWTIRRRARI